MAKNPYRSNNSPLFLGITCSAGVALGAISAVKPNNDIWSFHFFIAILIIALSALAFRFIYAQIGISALFLLLGCYNIGQSLAGAHDCGCFSYAIPPEVTAVIDFGLAFCHWLFLRTRLGFFTPRTQPFIITACFLLGILSALGGLNATSASGPGELLGELGNKKVPGLNPGPSHLGQFILIFRGSCAKCREDVPILRSLITQENGFVRNAFEIDLDKGEARRLLGNSSVSPIENVGVFSEYFDQVTLPIVLVRNGIDITGFYDLSDLQVRGHPP